MKNTICLFLILGTIAWANAQGAGPQAPEWKATVTVVDESGAPIEGADVTIGYYVPPPEGTTISLSSTRGVTDRNGLFSASGRTRSVDLLFGAGKEGYYRAHLDYELGAAYQYARVKWNPNITLLLKKVGKPIPMHAKRLLEGPPVTNESVGFDLMAGDWVAPHGKGQMRDFIFTKAFRLQSTSDYESKVKLTFSNPQDGIQHYVPSAPEKTSSFKSPHETPENGYEPELMRETSARPGQPGKFEYDPNRIYFFRVRTVLDEKGNVKSALYGKIYGDFMQFTFYLNPTPNSRNVEFDPAQNLIRGLRGAEAVTAP